MDYMKKVFLTKINKKLFIISILSLVLMLAVGITINKNNHVKNKYIDIDNLIREAYTYKNGYDDNMKKHMDIKVFNSSNLYRRYNEKKDESPPTDISLKLKEINQHKIDGKFFVYTKYDLEFNSKWCTDTVHTGSWDIPVVFQVVEKNGELYIEKKVDYDADCDVPKAYR